MNKKFEIFGNEIKENVINEAYKKQKQYIKKFGDDRKTEYFFTLKENPVLTPIFGVQILTLSNKPGIELPEKSIIIGNIRMGFGHYRISIAMASVAHSMGYTPLWLDLNSFPETLCTKIISHLNNLYSFGSRLSQKSKLFNKFYWEPLNSEGFRKLSYNASDQIISQLMIPIFKSIEKSIPFIATHVWPSQAAIHAGLLSVVNAIPDNWPMALHLSEGALHTVQTPSSYLGYKLLRGMDGDKVLKPMSSKDITYTGHYVDDEFVQNIEFDCNKRLNRLNTHKPLRFLLTIGGAGAQADIFCAILKTLIPFIYDNKVIVYINIGDFPGIWDKIKKVTPEIITLLQEKKCYEYFNNWPKTKEFIKTQIDNDITEGMICVFCNTDIFAAVYTTNLLMRASDVIVTKPSELSFYPVPKLFIQHIGGHEIWGAIRAMEVGDGTYECNTINSATSMAVNMIQDPSILSSMCKNIINNKKQGIYNGAYNVINLALNFKK